jgi:hypothetical protein
MEGLWLSPVGAAQGQATFLTLIDSNGSVITGNVFTVNGVTVDITLTGEGTALHGDFDKRNTSIINLTLGAGALLDGGGTVTANQFNIAAGTGVEGTFEVQNGQLTFTASAIPEPST